MAAAEVGDIATWVGGIGTAGALLVSLWLLRKDHDSRRSENEAALRAQARSVAAWVELTSRHAGVAASSLEAVNVNLSSGTIRLVDLVPSSTRASTDAVTAIVVAVNRSDEPVYDCRAILRLMSEGNQQVATLNIGVLGPRSTRKAPVRVLRTKPVDRMGIVVDVEFVDAVGIRWRRNAHGHLLQIGFATTVGDLREKLDGWSGPANLPRWRFYRRFVRWRRLRMDVTSELLRKITLR